MSEDRLPSSHGADHDTDIALGDGAALLRQLDPDLDPQALLALLHGDHGDPFSLLGMHPDSRGGLVVRAYFPGESGARVELTDAASQRHLATFSELGQSGFYSAHLPRRRRRFPYCLKVDGALRDDPYRFPPLLSDHDAWLLAEGSDLFAYRRLGAHPRRVEDVEGVGFAVWAPNARRVSVVGSFNGWDGRRHVMRLRHGCGVWEIFIPGLGAGALYKYEIKSAGGELLPLKADPMGFAAEHPPATASKVAALEGEGYEWGDAAWLSRRAATSRREAPIAIYEVHLGSWQRRHSDNAGAPLDTPHGRYLTYDELADSLLPYVKEMGFTHLEILPVSEYPFDGSWGYQPIGLFAPTSRFGGPDGFRRFVDRAHGAGLGVIADWVPGHFPTDSHGLGRFDGTHLYEHEDPRLGRHMDWGTLIYNYGRREVANFLISNAIYWLAEYHLDGLRVDAVASMLYLDYSRKPGEWLPNIHGGNENLEAIAFLRRMNEAAYGHDEGVMTAAEESTSWPMVSQPTYLGGLGFGYKWNMGWMHDTLEYMKQDPVHRRYHHDKLTFGLLYAFSENFILPLSHDEVVHGKGSLLGRMPGDRWQKFANLRAYFSFMYGHPGKKLIFMGGEFGQEREWDHDQSLDWHLLDDPAHEGVRRLVRDLNHLYRNLPALHARDCEAAGFEWIDSNDVGNSVLSFLRRGANGEMAVVVCNFTPVPRHDYRLGVPRGGAWRECLNSDAGIYGGGNLGNLGAVHTRKEGVHGRPYSLSLTLPPLATLVLAPEDDMPPSPNESTPRP